MLSSPSLHHLMWLYRLVVLPTPALLPERAPRTAHVWQDKQLVDVPAEAIDVGMEVVVKPGELIPVDGVVISGSSSVSEADLTGEPMSVRKMSGTLVLSGSVNLDGVLEVRASKRSTESNYAQIVRLIKEIVLLTGDSEVVAEQIGQVANVDRIVARCLPEEKVQAVQTLVRQGHLVLMVGDGVNDAPALATVTVGIALGSGGLTAASTAADAVLLSTDIHRVVTAVRLGRHVMHMALEGIWIGSRFSRRGYPH